MKERTTDPKLYRLQNEPGYFYAGHLKDGTQVFMSVDYPNLVAVLFNTDGRYLQYLVRALSQETQVASNEDLMNKGRSAFNNDWDELDRWAAEIGFTPGVIAVQKFSLPEFELGIQDLPQVYQELVDSGRELDEEVKELIQFWREENDYVLVWGNDYDIDREGNVLST